MKIVSKKDARDLGLKRYFTGKPCHEGHVCERLTSNSSCVICSLAKKKMWSSANKKHIAEKLRVRRSNNKEKFRSYDKKRYHADPRVKLLSAAKQRANKKGIEFDILIEDISIPELCPLLEIPLKIGNGTISDMSPTIDRIDNGLGYIKGNVMIISYAANRCKGALTVKQVLTIAKNLKTLAEKKGIV